MGGIAVERMHRCEELLGLREASDEAQRKLIDADRRICALEEVPEIIRALAVHKAEKGSGLADALCTRRLSDAVQRLSAPDEAPECARAAALRSTWGASHATRRRTPEVKTRRAR